MYNAPRYTLDHIPFLRLLIPLIVGIAWQYTAPSDIILYVWCAIALVGAMATIVLRKHLFSVWRKISFATFVNAVFIAIGMAVCINNTVSKELPTTTANTLAIACIENTPTEQEYTYRTQATIVALNDSNDLRNIHLKVLLHLQKSYTARTLQSGDIILFRPQLQPIESSRLPHSFDYSSFMARKGILYRQYLADGTWQLSQQQAPLSITQHAARIQQRCIESLKRCQLSQENQSLLSALLWGYKADIPDSMRQYFSSAGLSHILAVSGLHTGIIAFILWIILYPLRYTPIPHTRGIITLIVLWAYAFITGLSPSVVRACIMASFVGIAEIINRPNTSLNALCGSAVMILLMAPMQLFDIGFQLSYTAVAGIILLSPYFNINNLHNTHNPILRYIAGLIAASLAAQIATIPLASYYFHYIPMWGLLSNLLLTPLLTPLVFMALIMQLCEVVGLPHAWVDHATDTTASLLCNGANTIATLPGAVIEGVWVSLPMLILYGIMIIAIWYSLSHRTLRPITIILLTLITMQGYILYETLRPSTPTVLLPSEREYSHLQLCDNNRNCLIISTDTCMSIPEAGQEWRIREHLTAQRVVAGDTLATEHIYTALPFIEYYGKRILWVDNNIWRYSHASTPLDIDYAIITEKYSGHISQLQKNFNIDNIILSAGVYPEKAQELIQECLQSDINYHDTRIQGVWCVIGDQ